MELKIGSLNLRIGREKKVNAVVPSEEELNKAISDMMIQKGYTYDKLFTTGHMMEMITGTYVQKPYETIATVYKCVKAICDNVPQAELGIYNKSKKEKTDDQKLRAMLEHPNPDQTFHDFVQEWAGFYALNGEGFIHMTKSIGQVAGTGYGLPAELRNLNPQYMKEIVDWGTNKLVGWKYSIPNQGGQQTFTVDEILHTKDFNPYNQFRGTSPLKPIMDELEIDQATLIFNKAFFKNDATPGFALSTEQNLTEEQRNRIQEHWDKKNKGARKAFSTTVLEKGLKPITINPTHKEMDFVSQKALMREEIMGIWRAPKALFNITDSLNYATFMGQMRIFWIYCLIPIMAKFEASINGKIVDQYNSGLIFGFDLSNVPAFVEEMYQKSGAAEQYWKLGFTASEINEKLQLGFKDDSEWRKHGWVPWNMVTAEEAMTHPRIQETINVADPNADPKPPAADQQSQDKPKPKKYTIPELTLIKNFLRGQGSHEARLESKMSRYFNEIRVQALRTPINKLREGIVDIDWHKENEKIKKVMTPVLYQAIEHGVQIARDHKPKKSIEEDGLSHTLQSYLAVRADKVTRINSSLRDDIKTTLEDTLAEPTSQGLQADALGEVLKDSLRGVFNSAVTRARLIARTETAGAVNGGSWFYYKAIGITAKSWLTAGDERVRESHAMCQDQGVIDIDKVFQNGLQFPGDQNGDGSETCNCRCCLSPELE
jgi:HK97 family phage portal protein